MRVYRTGKSEVIALRGLNLDIKSGEIVAIMGPSGCGKTTLLNLIGGLDQPTAGNILVDGQNIVHYNEQQLVKYRQKTVGFVFQFFNLVASLDARENIELPMRLANVGAKARQQKVDEILELVGMSDRSTHKPDALSGGEQQRIAIGTALANDPEILLADEPTGELDTETGKQIFTLFNDLRDRLGKTIVIVTHDLRIANFADRALEIEDGMIKGELKYQDMRRRVRLEAGLKPGAASEAEYLETLKLDLAKKLREEIRREFIERLGGKV